MAEEKTYQCIHPNRAIRGPDAAVRFDQFGRFTTSDPEQQALIESHEWFGGVILPSVEIPELPPVPKKIEHDDLDALAAARRIAAKVAKPEARVGLVGTDAHPTHEDDAIFNPAMDEPTVPDPEPEPIPLEAAADEAVYPTRAEINYMKMAQLKDLIKQHGLDVDPNLGYHVLKAEVKKEVEKKQLGLE
ncbi:MAG: hypothetical protein ACYS7Y_32570 [Planctomycetota bacterium]|jgi:hypothetical protein